MEIFHSAARTKLCRTAAQKLGDPSRLGVSDAILACLVLLDLPGMHANEFVQRFCEIPRLEAPLRDVSRPSPCRLAVACRNLPKPQPTRERPPSRVFVASWKARGMIANLERRLILRASVVFGLLTRRNTRGSRAFQYEPTLVVA